MRDFFLLNEPCGDTDKADSIPLRRFLMRHLVSFFTLLVIPFSLVSADFPTTMRML